MNDMRSKRRFFWYRDPILMGFDLEGGNVMTKAYPDMKAYPDTGY
jgi:hypothetical protein